MIQRVTEPSTDAEIAALLEPEVEAWFNSRFPGFTPPQRYAVREIHEGKNVLISSPTGSGKTLSAFLACLNELFAIGRRGELEDRVYCLYVSPLKALNNDIERNLHGPLEGIRGAFEARGLDAPDVRVGVRTGDTSKAERAKQSKKPPHILITTPETLAILLVAPRFREHLRRVRWVLVDEVHALAENKRGTHLALSLERLQALAEVPPVRVGLSATIAPLEDIGAFVFGSHRPGLLVDVQAEKQSELRVMSPVPDLVGTRHRDVQEHLYRTLDDLIEKHRTTLVFTNSRSGTERVVHQLRERYGEKYAELHPDEPDALDAEAVEVDEEAPEGEKSFVAAHHGSLSRERRLEVEERLKRGELKCVVCSTSLELGIDIGSVDLVVMLGSPKGIARALQRVGRAGHNLQSVSKGVLLVLDRDDLVECTVLAKKAREKRLDRIRIPANALDVLCQHLVGMGLEHPWDLDDAYRTVRGASPYRDLSREDFDACLRYLAGSDPRLEERSVYGKIWVDEAENRFGKRGKRVRAIYSMNVGTIPDSQHMKVFAGDRYVGEVEEDFVEGLVPGDVFVLGGDAWRFQRAQGMKAYVAAAPGKQPTVPAWTSESLPLNGDLAGEIRAFRRELRTLLEADEPTEKAIAFLKEEYQVDDVTASALWRYMQQQHAFAGIPTEQDVIVEEFVDDELRRNYVFHTLHGRRTNEVLARAFGRDLGNRKGVNVRLQVSDNGFALQVPRGCVLSATQVRDLFLQDVDRNLERALANTELLKRRFRHVATRSFLILRRYAGRSKTVGRQQVNAFVLYHVLRKIDPHFPVLQEAHREIREDALDVAAARQLCDRVRDGAVQVRLARRLKAPSPFAHHLVALGSTDTVLMEDRKSLVRDLHERVMMLLGEEATDAPQRGTA